MCNITVGRYDDPEPVGYSGWAEPENKAWILFVDSDCKPVLFDRDPVTGAVK